MQLSPLTVDRYIYHARATVHNYVRFCYFLHTRPLTVGNSRIVAVERVQREVGTRPSFLPSCLPSALALATSSDHPFLFFFLLYSWLLSSRLDLSSKGSHNMPASRGKLSLRSNGRRRSGTTSTRHQASSRRLPVSVSSRLAASRSSASVSRTPRPSNRVHSVTTPQPSTYVIGDSELPPSGLSQEHRPRNFQSEPDDDSLNEIIMSVDLGQKDMVGCCYYVARDEKMYFMEDVQSGGVAAVDARKYRCLKHTFQAYQRSESVY